MRGDLLSGGLPKKLLCQDGNWTLEVVRQVAVERNVYRPHVQKLQGRDAILGYLRRSTQFRPLADAATGLLAQGEAESRSYEVVNGEWTPSVLAPSYIDELKRQHQAAAHKTHGVRLLEVRTECLRLRHANARLSKRVEELERRLDNLDAVVEALRTRQPQVVPPPAPATLSQPEEHAAEPAQAPIQEAAAHVELPKLRLPKVSELTRCIEQLIGSETTAHETQDMLDVGSGEKLFASLLLSEDDHVIGAIVMDVVATVFLGGTLLMVPENDLAGQISTGKPSEDSIAASSEVCNALSGSINNVADNVPVRTKYLEEFNPTELPWVSQASARMTLQDSFGGRILIVCR